MIWLVGDDDVNRDLLELRNELVERRNRLVDRYPSLPKDDPRRATARHIRAVTSATYLARIFQREHLADKAWWNLAGMGDLLDDPAAAQDEVDDFGVFLTLGFIVYSFHVFEAGLRTVGRAMRIPVGDTGPFANVYRAVFSLLTFPTQEDWAGLLDLYRPIRNTIHNNGKHIGPTQLHQWRGVEFEFVDGDVPTFLGWPLYISVVRALGALNEEVMTTPEVSALPAMSRVQMGDS